MSDARDSFRQFTRLLRYALPYRKIIMLTLFFMTLYGVANATRLMLIEPTLKAFMETSGGGRRPSVWSRTVGALVPRAWTGEPEPEPEPEPEDAPPVPSLDEEGFNQLVTLGVWFGLFSIVIGLSVSCREYFLRYLVNRSITDLRRDLYRNLTNLDLRFFDNQRVGELISRVTNDVSATQTILRSTVDDLVQEPMTLAGLVVVAFLTSWQLSLFSFLIMPLILYPLLVFGRLVRRHAGRSLGKLADATEVMQQTFSGIKIVKAFGAEAHEFRRFQEANEGYFRKAMRVVRAKAFSRGLIEFFYNAGSGILVILGALLVLHAVWGLDMPRLIQFMFIIISMYQPLKTLSKAYNNIQEALAGSTRVFTFMDRRPELADAPGAVGLGHVERGVAFRGVAFAYDAEPVIRGVDLEVKAGEVVALVGESGAGKTTLLDLLARFYDVQEGSIEIDGIDIRGIRREALHGKMALVTQEPFLFNASVRENILYGRPGASQQEVEEAAKAAYIHEFVAGELEHGYDTIVGERGAKLSGGQKQRITIARALIRDPEILILDEATGALDSETENQVQAALNNLMKGRTTFIIAHRLSTVQHADRILVLDKGRIVESGTHQDLLALGAVYARLHEQQFLAGGTPPPAEARDGTA